MTALREMMMPQRKMTRHKLTMTVYIMCRLTGRKQLDQDQKGAKGIEAILVEVQA